MMTEPTVSKKRRRSRSSPGTVYGLALRVMDRHGLSALLLAGGSYWAAQYVFHPLVDATRESMSLTSSSVKEMEDLFRAAEVHRVEQSARVTKAVEDLSREMQASRQHREELARQTAENFRRQDMEMGSKLNALEADIRGIQSRLQPGGTNGRDQ